MGNFIEAPKNFHHNNQNSFIMKNSTTKGLMIILIIISSCNTNNNNTKEQLIDSTIQSVNQTENTPTQETQPQEEVKKEWVKVKSWKGVGLKKTETFKIEEGNWRVIWNFSAPGAMGMFIIASYRPGIEEPEDYLANVANELKGSDTSYVHTSGEFYLEINAVNCKWNVSIEEEKQKK
jgi:hypothetical protein